MSAWIQLHSLSTTHTHTQSVSEVRTEEEGWPRLIIRHSAAGYDVNGSYILTVNHTSSSGTQCVHVCAGHEEGGGRSFITLRHLLSFHPLLFFIIPSPCFLLRLFWLSSLFFCLHLLFFSPPRPFLSLSPPPSSSSFPKELHPAGLFVSVRSSAPHAYKSSLPHDVTSAEVTSDGGRRLSGPPHSYSSIFFFSQCVCS